MLIILCILGFKLHTNQEHETFHNEKTNQITTNDISEDDFIYPTDECESTIDNETEAYIIGIVNCSFIDCSKEDYVILITNNNTGYFIKSCIFEFTDYSKSASILYSTSPMINIYNNTFKKCSKNTINYKPANFKEFLLTSNFFSECYVGTIINFDSPTTNSAPLKIQDNTFEKVSINEPSFQFNLGDGIQIAFDNVTFRNFDIKSKFGGIGLKIWTTLSRYSIFFRFCTFLNNTNRNVKNGGALSGHFERDGNVRYWISYCTFESNSALNDGGAIYLSVKESLLVYNSKFIRNKASKNGGAICIEPYEIESIIFISISKCTFIDNQADELGSSLYVCNEDKKMKPITISDCVFEGGDVYIIDEPTSETIFKNINFTKISSQTALVFAQKTVGIYPFKMMNCLFEQCCSNQPFVCFNLSLMTNYFELNDNVVQNSTSDGCDVYIGNININHQMNQLKLSGWTFQNNVCKSLYGGGIGVTFSGIECLVFDGCSFIENKAKQDKSKSRSFINGTSYYNGDGGGIQLGYSCSFCDFDVRFEFCNFSNNEADRHGGAVALQTLRTVSIVNCSFVGNVANCMQQKKSLLTSDYFDLKKYGRGGAIYINPSFVNDCKGNSSFMLSVEIENCSFVKNNGYDGYAMFVEGDDLGTNFSIIQNVFVDNYNQTNHYKNNTNIIRGSVISSEIDMDVIDSNFTYSHIDVVVSPFEVVDHAGIDEETDDSFDTSQPDFSPPFESSDSTQPFIPDDRKKKGLSKKAIIGIACGCAGFVVIAVTVTVVVYFVVRKKNINLYAKSEIETQMISDKDNSHANL